MEEFKGRDVAFASDCLRKVFIKDKRNRRRLFFSRAFEHHFGPGGGNLNDSIFKSSNARALPGGWGEDVEVSS